MDSELVVDHDYMPTSNSNPRHKKNYALGKEDQLFIVLCRYQQGFSEEHLTVLFGIYLPVNCFTLLYFLD